MATKVTAHFLSGQSTVNVEISRYPDHCPLCHRHVRPQFLSAQMLEDGARCWIIFRCTNEKCQEPFIATYAVGRSGAVLRGEIVKLSPTNAGKVPTPDLVATLSPTYVEIRNQAEAAEAAGLSQLVGIGLRKALEFLMKDFAISENSDLESEIRAMPLASCIKKYARDENVKQCAERATWLGNDETHYTRRWETKDVRDLKVLVQLTVNWIENALLTKKYLDEMN